MNVIVDLLDETGEINEEQKQLVRRLIDKAFTHEEQKGELELSVTFVNDERIREINREYRARISLLTLLRLH